MPDWIVEEEWSVGLEGEEQGEALRLELVVGDHVARLGYEEAKELLEGVTDMVSQMRDLRLTREANS